MVDFISINQFSIEHIKDETKPFVFGTKFDLAGKPNVGLKINMYTVIEEFVEKFGYDKSRACSNFTY